MIIFSPKFDKSLFVSIQDINIIIKNTILKILEIIFYDMM